MTEDSRDPTRIDTPEGVGGRRWLGLAVGSMMLSGALALGLVFARVPGAADLVTDPGFFRRCLVVHVDLSLVVWLYAFIAGLSWLLVGPNESSSSSRLGVEVSIAGVLLLLTAAGVPHARPVLANYLPMIDHWLFGAGLVVFGLGVLLSVLDRRLFREPARYSVLLANAPAAIPGLRATSIALILAALTFLGSWLVRPAGLSSETLFELTSWGGGHVLMLACSAAMVSVWLILLGGVLRSRAAHPAVDPRLAGTERRAPRESPSEPVSRRAAQVLFLLLVLPWLSAPLLTLFGVQSIEARDGFMKLMQWGIFPIVLVFLALCVRALVRAGFTRQWLSDPRVTGFCVSALLCVLGWVLGALIRGSTTMVPAHYHASIGAVTVAFMSVTYPLLESYGFALPNGRLGRLIAWQPAVFGLGQSVFALGFAIAGASGMGRKLYGSEQAARGLGHTLGLAVMGIGGLVAVSGGLLYLTLVVVTWRKQERRSIRTAIEPLWRHS